MNCPSCGSAMVRNGTRAYSDGVIKQRWTCKKCHHNDFMSVTPEDFNHGARYSCVSLKEVAKTWLANGSIQLVIPKQLAAKAGFDRPENVIVEEVEHGILRIRRLEV